MPFRGSEIGGKRASLPRVTGPVRLVIVDDHPLVMEGLHALISPHPDLEVCGEASDVQGALKVIQAVDPHLTLVDLNLNDGNGLDLIKRIRASGSQTRILVVSAFDETLFAERALQAGAQGYVQKHEAPSAVIEAIRTVLRGEVSLSRAMGQRLVLQAVMGRSRPRGVEALSDRELEVFQLIGRGIKTSAIAEQLHLSIHTIESHRESIRRKLELRDGPALVRTAVQWVIEKG